MGKRNVHQGLGRGGNEEKRPHVKQVHIRIIQVSFKKWPDFANTVMNMIPQHKRNSLIS
jgi:hypothetical protein